MRGLVIRVLLSLTMDVTSRMSSIQLISQYPDINGSVTLKNTGITETNVSFIWYKGPKPDSQRQILTHLPGDSPTPTPGPVNNPRITAFNNRSLQITDRHTTDGGNDIVKIQTVKPTQTVAVTLTVYEPVTRPKIRASTSQFQEDDPFTLICDTSHATTITWTRRGTSISSDTKLSGGNKTLTFSSVKRDDSGDYRCEAENLASKASSDPYTVTVAYGPDEAQIEGPVFVSLGSPITLSCYADSVPPSKYQWNFNDVLKEENDKLDINNATTENQGLYTCVVRNPLTLRTATASVYVNVTAEVLTSETWAVIKSIIGASLVLTLGVALGIIGSFFLYRKRRTRNRNEPSENGQEQNPVYENVLDKVKAEQPQEESSYMGLHFKSEDTYVELKT